MEFDKENKKIIKRYNLFDYYIIRIYDEFGRCEEESYYSYISNKKHRVGSPAQINYYPSGRVESYRYYFEGQLHNLDGPAYKSYHPDGKKFIEGYYIFGKKHRIDEGPVNVVKYIDGKVQEFYYKDDKFISFREYN